MREEMDALLHDGSCVQKGEDGAGVGTLWAAEAYSPAIFAHAADEGLKAAALKVLNSSSQGRAALEDDFELIVGSTAFFQNMDARSRAGEDHPCGGLPSIHPSFHVSSTSVCGDEQRRPRTSREREIPPLTREVRKRGDLAPLLSGAGVFERRGVPESPLRHRVRLTGIRLPHGPPVGRSEGALVPRRRPHGRRSLRAPQGLADGEERDARRLELHAARS